MQTGQARSGTAPQLVNYDTSRDHAEHCATRAADTHGLPQTVFRDKDSCGWWHTNSLAGRLDRAELAVTMLPARYFTG
ncbi:hypothetical protein ACU4GI_32930 [Cupriavidus basilensis]